MRSFCILVIAAALVACFSGCSTTGISANASYNPDYGPFDRNGNYVEAWADQPARKHGWARKPATPAATTSPSATPKKDPPLIAANSPRSTANTRTVARVQQPTRPATVSRPSPTLVRPAVTRPVSRPPVIAASTAPRRAASPPKPKPKPKPAVRHTVRKGDTLYGLSRRYGSSVSAIQRANGLRGTTIRLGQSLRIPK